MVWLLWRFYETGSRSGNETLSCVWQYDTDKLISIPGSNTCKKFLRIFVFCVFNVHTHVTFFCLVIDQAVNLAEKNMDKWKEFLCCWTLKMCKGCETIHFKSWRCLLVIKNSPSGCSAEDSVARCWEQTLKLPIAASNQYLFHNDYDIRTIHIRQRSLLKSGNDITTIDVCVEKMWQHSGSAGSTPGTVLTSPEIGCVAFTLNKWSV